MLKYFRVFNPVWSLRIIVTCLLTRIIKPASTSLTCLVGKTALVTGANSGIGYNVCLQLASRGCRLIMADKDDQTISCQKIKEETGNTAILTKHVDLASFASVRKLAKELNETETKIDILINNAGITNTNLVTKDGINIIMQVNYLSPFLLTHHLLDLLKAAPSSRIIFTSSILSFVNNLSLDTLNPEPYHEDDFATKALVYGNSKACNIFAAREFGKKLRKHGITANSADPGFVNTGIFNKAVNEANAFMGKIMKFFIKLVSRTGFEGSQTCVHVATSKSLENVTSTNFYDCGKFKAPALLEDEQFCRDLWEASEQMVNLEEDRRIIS